MDGVDLEFTDEAVKAIAKKALEQNTGARGLRTIVEGAMRQVMFDIPSQKDVSKVVIDEGCINEGKEPTIVYKKKKTKTEDSSNKYANGEIGA